MADIAAFTELALRAVEVEMRRTSLFVRLRKKPYTRLAGQEEQQRMVSLIAAVNAQDRP